MGEKKFKWTIEIEVSETWVADGFNATEDRVRGWLETDLGFATEGEVGAKIVKAPSDESLAKAQGFRTVGEFRAASA